MDWKEFFRITWVKILLFVLLLILTFFIPKTSRQCNMAPQGVICKDIEVRGIGYPLHYGEYFRGDAGVIPSGGFLVIVAISNIIIWYSVSCLVIFLYDRIRNKG